MRKILLIVAPFLILRVSVAQVQRCASTEAMQEIAKTDAQYFNRVNHVFEQAQQQVAQKLANRDADDTVYHIRCVFHVVYASNQPEENIPDSVIFSQIQILNEDYRRLNADAVKTRSVFLPVAADTKIEFELATEDPDGNPTTGITRKTGSGGVLGFNPFQDNVKSTTSGGQNPWPTDRYLNIWICNMFLGVLGYAYPPSNAPNWPANSSVDSARQGVVLHYQCVGRNFSNPIDATVAGGRSATHEIGHYLGLRHIWGDTTGCNKVDGDGIADTPKHADAHQQTCDTADNSCADAPFDFPDMIENYMDYSDDRCLNMFTEGQKNLMRTMLQTSRRGIAYTTIETSIPSVVSHFSMFSASPNPATEFLRVEVQLPTTETTCNFGVFDVSGRQIHTQISSGFTTFIPVNNLCNGTYFLSATSASKHQVLKFVVQR